MGWFGPVARRGQEHHSGMQPDSGSWEDLGSRTGRTRRMSGAWHCPPSIRIWDHTHKVEFCEWFGGSVQHAIKYGQRKRGGVGRSPL